MPINQVIPIDYGNQWPINSLKYANFMCSEIHQLFYCHWLASKILTLHIFLVSCGQCTIRFLIDCYRLWQLMTINNYINLKIPINRLTGIDCYRLDRPGTVAPSPPPTVPQLHLQALFLQWQLHWLKVTSWVA